MEAVSGREGSLEGAAVTPATGPQLPLRWPRDAPAPPALGGSRQSVLCLWAGGFLCHRTEVCRRLNHAPQVALADVVASACERWGASFVDRLEGTVSAVLWSRREGALLLVADRTGHGAVSWALTEGVLWVGSSPGEILSALPARPPLDRDSLLCHVGAQAPPVGRTFFSGLRLVPPGHRLWLTPHRRRLECYWDPESGGASPPADLEEGGDPGALLDLLRDVVDDYATEGMGITLSSGLDSNSLAAAAVTSPGSAPLTGFTWAFRATPSADETAAARGVARHLDIPLHEVDADRPWPLSGRGPLTAPEDPFRLHYEELWQATFRRVRGAELGLLCTGTGGDSLFAGATTTYADLLVSGRWLELARQMGRHLPHSRIGLRQVVRRMVLWPLVAAYAPPLRTRAVSSVPWLPESQRGRFVGLMRCDEPPVRLQLPSRYLRLREVRNRTLPWVLRRLATLGRLHGVRVVHPYLDRRLVEAALRLPAGRVFAAGLWKVALRQAMRGLLPDEVVERRHKIVPVAHFERGLREKERTRVAELTTGMRAADLGLVDEDALRRHCRDYVEGRNADCRFWYTLTLEDWLRNHF